MVSHGYTLGVILTFLSSMFETGGYCLWRVHHVARAGSGGWGAEWASRWVWFAGMLCVVAGA
eukprot:123495-Rhodomonas_salina.1